MEIRELDRGERAPEGSDYITLNILKNGKVGFTGVRQMGDVTSHAISPNSFETEEDALAEAVKWAEDSLVTCLYVQRPGG